MASASDSTPAATTARPLSRHLPTAARLLLGLLFLASGVAGLVMTPPAMTSPPMPEGLVALMNGFMKSGYLFQLLKVTEAVVGLALLANRFVPLALTVLAPVSVNIFAVHLVLEHSGLPIALVVVALHGYLGWSYRESFRPMLVARARPTTG